MSMPLIPVPKGLQTEIFALGKGALDCLAELLSLKFPGKNPWIIADENTWQAAGKRAEELLCAAGMKVVQPFIFPGSPRLHPDYDHSVMLAGKMPENCVPVAVGSGVINDLTKCASGIREVPYCCVPTACSVDGYTSAGAALSVKGTKKTVKCPAPFAVCADVDILATAPAPMLASGYADLLTKVPAGVDWIIADAVGETPIDAEVWDFIQGHIREWVSDHTNMLNIFHGLAATGYSMQMYHDSRPASGAEHLFSHVWEMEGLQKDGEDVSHGFKVGVGLLASTLLQEYVLKHDFEELVPRMKRGLSEKEREREIDDLLRKGCYGPEPRITAMKKHLAGDALEARRLLIREIWDSMRQRMHERLIPYADALRMLRSAHCPATPGEIGLTAEQFLHGIRTAQLIRIRYTVLDLLYELGLLEDAMRDLCVMLQD